MLSLFRAVRLKVIHTYGLNQHRSFHIETVVHSFLSSRQLSNLLSLSPAQCWCSRRCGIAASAGRSRSWWRWCTSTRRRWSTSTPHPVFHWCVVRAAAGTTTWSVTQPAPLTSLCRYGTESATQHRISKAAPGHFGEAGKCQDRSAKRVNIVYLCV